MIDPDHEDLHATGGFGYPKHSVQARIDREIRRVVKAAGLGKMTPEGKVKKEVKRVLDAFGVYYFMPVQMGLGAAGLDFHCVVRFGDCALAFFIETKAPDKEPTGRQEEFIKERRLKQLARTFVIDGDLNELVEFLERVEEYNEHRNQSIAEDAGSI